MIDYQKMSIAFRIPDHSIFEFVGSNSHTKLTELRARPAKGGLVVMDIFPIEISVMLEILNILEDFYELFLDRAFGFSNDIIPCIVPISKALYLMGPIEVEDYRS